MTNLKALLGNGNGNGNNSSSAKGWYSSLSDTSDQRNVVPVLT